MIFVRIHTEIWGSVHGDDRVCVRVCVHVLYVCVCAHVCVWVGVCACVCFRRSILVHQCTMRSEGGESCGIHASAEKRCPATWPPTSSPTLIAFMKLRAWALRTPAGSCLHA